MKVLILGSEGFIGNKCVHYFLKQGHDITGIDLFDLKEFDYPYLRISRLNPDYTQFFKYTNYDVCINAAGSGSVPLSFDNTKNDFEANTIEVFNLLETIRTYNRDCKFINISSAAVYGNPESLPITESDNIHPLSPYGWHKYYSELICKEYTTLYGLNTISVRPFSVYGPGLKKQLFWDIYQKSKKSDVVELFGTGHETRDFIYINDLISAIDHIINFSQFDGGVINVASGKEHTIGFVTEFFIKSLNPNLSLTFNGIVKKGDPLNWRADISKLNSLGFKTNTEIETGLIKLTEWLREKA